MTCGEDWRGEDLTRLDCRLGVVRLIVGDETERPAPMDSAMGDRSPGNTKD